LAPVLLLIQFLLIFLSPLRMRFFRVVFLCCSVFVVKQLEDGGMQCLRVPRYFEHWF